MGYKGLERRSKCDVDTCQYHALRLTDLKEAVAKLMEGQTEMRDTVIQLAEAFKGVDKMSERIEKLEDRQHEKDKEQDDKIDALKAHMYKVMGAVSTVVTIAGLVVVLL